MKPKSLSMILEKLVGQCEGIVGEDYLEFKQARDSAISDILELIPKKKYLIDNMKDLSGELMDLEEVADKKINIDGYNQAIQDTIDRLKGEE